MPARKDNAGLRKMAKATVLRESRVYTNIYIYIIVFISSFKCASYVQLYLFFKCVSFVHVSETVAIRVRSGRLYSGSGRILRNGDLLDKPRLPILPGFFGIQTKNTTRYRASG